MMTHVRAACSRAYCVAVTEVTCHRGGCGVRWFRRKLQGIGLESRCPWPGLRTPVVVGTLSTWQIMLRGDTGAGYTCPRRQRAEAGGRSGSAQQDSGSGSASRASGNRGRAPGWRQCTPIRRGLRCGRPPRVPVTARLSSCPHTALRRNRGPEAAEDGEGEGGVPDHLTAGDQHHPQGAAPQHRDGQGKGAARASSSVLAPSPVSVLGSWASWENRRSRAGPAAASRR